jgi:YVTN family beta-propeller protein
MSIAITPNGKTAYVANYGSGTVTVLSIATDRATGQVEVGKMPQTVLVTPDGKTAYVANFGSNSVSPIDTATNKPGPAIAVGSEPYALAIVPHHQSIYVVNYGSGTVTPISTATNKAGRAVRVGTDPESIAFAADGETALVANEGSNSETRIDTATGASSTSPVGNAPVSVLIETLVEGQPHSHYASYKPSDKIDVIWTIAAAVCDNNAFVSEKYGYFIITLDRGGSIPLGGKSSQRDDFAVQKDQLLRIPLGVEPGPMVFSPRNGTIYIVNEGSGDVTPIMITAG